VELFIIRVKFAIHYFLHFNTVRQVAARLRAKSAIYDCLVVQLQDDCQHHQQISSTSSSTLSQPHQVMSSSSTTTAAMSRLSTTTPTWQSSGSRSSSVPASGTSMSHYQHSVFAGQGPPVGRCSHNHRYTVVVNVYYFSF